MTAEPPILTLLDGPWLIPGHVCGFRQPSLWFQVQLPRGLTRSRQLLQLIRVDSLLRDTPYPTPLEATGNEDIRITYLLSWMTHLLAATNQPVFDQAVIHAPASREGAVWELTFPCLDSGPALAALKLSLHALALAHTADRSGKRLRSEIAQAREQYRPQLELHHLGGAFNMIHFLRCAYSANIPWFQFSSDTYQFGQGRNARLFYSSMTDATPGLSIRLARSKWECSRVLRQAGLPVPPQLPARSQEQAIRAAQRLTFPVVVKPEGLDGGRGVSACLNDTDAVAQAYAAAASVANDIIVEKHVDGHDYRVLVANGQVIGALRRAPGGVTGDGRLSVKELLVRQNEERATARDDRRYLHPMEMDAEAERMLKDAGLGWATVPESGEFVRLRGVANIASGGTPTAVDLEKIHPDNAKLAIQVARILRLDVAGLDILMADIEQSWRQIGAAICEVNAQPQMFTLQHGPMLRAIMPTREGRVPVMIVCSSVSSTDFEHALYHELLRVHPDAALATRDFQGIGAISNNVCESPFSAGRALLMDPAVEALILRADHEDVRANGWPVDQCDLAMILGDDTSPASPGAVDGMSRMYRQVRELNAGAILFDSAARRDSLVSEYPDIDLPAMCEIAVASGQSGMIREAMRRIQEQYY